MLKAYKLFDVITTIIYSILRKENVLTGDWHLGTVDSVISRYTLKVFVDGNTVSIKVPCNPDIIFNPGDRVFVLFINGNRIDRFVPFKRAVETGS